LLINVPKRIEVSAPEVAQPEFHPAIVAGSLLPASFSLFR
jgi:hypothetical protein